ncbi:hypothetical protein TWF718_007572 [Orbilia javanica]|uniref:Phosphatidylserine decarboxylase n=1 Tax=Orbilia javanica TaxID=47235 RepID=A0AAN8MUH2_9PEZI
MKLYLREDSPKEGKQRQSLRSGSKIMLFVDFYNINMKEFTPSDTKAYGTFEDFFSREHAHGSRPICQENDQSYAVVPSDCRVVVYPSVYVGQKLWINGQHFSMTNIFGDPFIAESFADGPVASFRLSPQDCHRYHSPVTGTVRWYKQYSGEYFNIDPWNLRSHIDAVSSNARCAICFETDRYGEVMFVAIGGSGVGTVNFREDVRISGSKIRKGQEIGRFGLGGSTILVFFQKGRILFDQDLLSYSNERIMIDVETGMSLGQLRQKGNGKHGNVDGAEKQGTSNGVKPNPSTEKGDVIITQRPKKTRASRPG